MNGTGVAFSPDGKPSTAFQFHDESRGKVQEEAYHERQKTDAANKEY